MLLRKVFILFNVEKQRSASDVVMGTVKRIFISFVISLKIPLDYFPRQISAAQLIFNIHEYQTYNRILLVQFQAFLCQSWDMLQWSVLSLLWDVYS